MRRTEIVEVVECDTAGEFLDYLRGSAEAWSPDPARWVFRGQRSDAWPLVPRSLRPGTVLSYRDDAPVVPLASSRHQVIAEFELLRLFIMVADRQGLVLPEDGHVMRTPEGFLEVIGPSIRAAFSSAGHWPPPQLLSVLALAQHYGVPTRLLDWSERGWTAAYFAAVGAARYASDGRKSGTAERMTVWALNQRYVLERWNAEDVEVLMVTAPRASNPNLQAQSGVFTVHRPADHRLERAVPLDVVIACAGEIDAKEGSRRCEHFPLMRRVTLPCGQAGTVLRMLYYEGVDAASVFPGLGGVVQSLDEKLLWDVGWNHPWGTMSDPHAKVYFGSDSEDAS